MTSTLRRRRIAPFRSLVAVCLVGLTWLATPTQPVCAEAPWSQFRGPNFNGSSPTTGLPEQFGQQESVVWSAAMPGPSAATPVVHEDRVFVSATDLERGKLVAMCLDRRSGEVLWQHDVADELRKDTRSTYSAPTPATDGNLVIFFFGNGDLVAYDMEGRQQWRKNLGPFAFMWTFSTSPLLYEGRLYMQILQRNYRSKGGRRGEIVARDVESYLLALDPATGDELWRHIRPSNAVEESLEAFTSPVPMEHNGRKEILIAGGDAISGHDPATGEEIWRWGTWNPRRIPHWRLVPSPVYGDGVVLVCAPKKEPIFALPAGKQGALDFDQLLWISDDERALSSDVPTPAFHDGDFFVLSDVQRSISRVHPRTGEIVWTTETPGRDKYEASPTVADGKIYLINFVGEVTVVDAEDGEILLTVPMEPETGSEHKVRSSVVADSGQLLIRTNTRLWCIGEED